MLPELEWMNELMCLSQPLVWSNVIQLVACGASVGHRILQCSPRKLAIFCSLMFDDRDFVCLNYFSLPKKNWVRQKRQTMMHRLRCCLIVLRRQETGRKRSWNRRKLSSLLTQVSYDTFAVCTYSISCMWLFVTLAFVCLRLKGVYSSS